MAVNHVIEIGNLVRDAEMKFLSNGTAVSKFAIAVNERRKQGEQWVDEANFFDVVLYGKSAENLNQYLVKGKQVAVEGKLHQSRWEAKASRARKSRSTRTTSSFLAARARDTQTPRRPPRERPRWHRHRPTLRTICPIPRSRSKRVLRYGAIPFTGLLHYAARLPRLKHGGERRKR